MLDGMDWTLAQLTKMVVAEPSCEYAAVRRPPRAKGAPVPGCTASRVLRWMQANRAAGGNSWVRFGDLQAELGVTRSSLAWALRYLETLGHVSVAVAGRGRAFLYRLRGDWYARIWRSSHQLLE